MPVSGWQGIRAAGTSGQYLITGTSGSNGLLYDGPISGVGGTAYSVNYHGRRDHERLRPRPSQQRRASPGRELHHGQRPNPGVSLPGNDSPISRTAAITRRSTIPMMTYTYVHSTMGDLAVGNGGDVAGRDGPRVSLQRLAGQDSDRHRLSGLDDDARLTASGTTAERATRSAAAIARSSPAGQNSLWRLSGRLRLVDRAIHQLDLVSPIRMGWSARAWRPIFRASAAPKRAFTRSVPTRLSQGRAPSWWPRSRPCGVNPDGTFGPAVWTNLNDPGLPDPLTADAVAGNQVVGIGLESSGIISYQATVNTGFQLSNVISGNGGNGIGIYGAGGNPIAMNNIGTDASGTLKRGNAKNGILVTDGATGEFHRRPGDRRQRSHGRRDRPPAPGQPDLGQSRQRRADHQRSDTERC